MRIWLVNHYALSPDSSGGTRHYDLAKKLVEYGHEVTIIAASFNHWTKRDEHCRDGQLFATSTHAGVNFIWLKTPLYAGSFGRLFNMLGFSWRLLRRTGLKDLPQPDVIIGSSPHLFAARTALSLSVKLDVPFVMEVRDLWPQTLLDLGHMSRFHPLVMVFSKLEKTLYRQAKHVIALMPGAVSYISNLGAGDADRVTWIPNGVDLQQLPCTDPEDDGVLDVVYAGSHGVANGLDTIVRAIYQLGQAEDTDSFRFAFYGDGPEKQRLQQLAAELGIGNLSFKAAIPKADVYRLMQKADAFIVTLVDSPLYKYGISLNKLYDYLALARPVIFGGKALNNPVAESGAGLVVPPEDSQALAAALRELAKMPKEQRVEMGRRGREFVANHHDVAKLARKLELVCFEAVDD